MRRIGRWCLKAMDRWPLLVPFGLVFVVVLGLSGTPALAVAMGFLVVAGTHWVLGWAA